MCLNNTSSKLLVTLLSDCYCVSFLPDQPSHFHEGLHIHAYLLQILGYFDGLVCLTIIIATRQIFYDSELVALGKQKNILNAYQLFSLSGCNIVYFFRFGQDIILIPPCREFMFQNTWQERVG